MKLYITGAGGFIGEELCNFFSKQKKIKKIYALYFKNFSSKKNKKIEQIRGDASRISKIPKNIDVLIHLATKNPENTSASKVLNINNKINKNIINLDNKNKVRKIIFSSSIAVYENLKKKVVNENDLNTSPSSAYARSKFLGEKILINKKKKNFRNIIILRFPTILGRKSEFNSLSSIKKKILNNEKINIYNPKQNIIVQYMLIVYQNFY